MHPELQQLLADHPDNGYLRFHLPRYVSLFSALAQRHAPGDRVLDIGRSVFTDALRARFGTVDTLGFGEDHAGETGNHYGYDLNHVRHGWRENLPRYDHIVFAEVLEHLYTSPAEVLPFLRDLLAEGGHIYLQTPNAVALNKRLNMLLGRNPFEMIRPSDRDPGHFREYTRAELATVLGEVGLEPVHFSYENYFDLAYIHHAEGSDPGARRRGRLYNLLFSLVPGSLCQGLFFIARRPPQAA